MLALDDALGIIEDLATRAAAAGEPLDTPLILVGGTALAAYGVRELSDDVDLYARSFPADIVAAVEADERKVRGPAFKLDVTPTENIWGSILVRDIAEDAGAVVRTLHIAGRSYEVRVLGLETLFLLKLAAGRERDLADLRLLAPRTSAEKLITRFNTIIRWHGDRQALPGLADAFVSSLESLFQASTDVIDRLALPQYVRKMLWEVRQ